MTLGGLAHAADAGKVILIEAGLAFGGVFMLLALWGYVRQLGVQRTAQRFEAVVQEHLPVLLRKRRLLVRVDDYGVVDRSRWEKEIDYFFTKVVAQQLQPADLAHVQDNLPVFRQRLEQLVEGRQVELGTQARFDSVRNGREFELFCADELKKSGWQVTVSRGSRDQGADIIATRGKDQLVVQCKLLNRPVGNYAVQEVVAARAHHSCNRAMVVSNQGFTGSAIELAATNDVQLCHWSELARL